MSILDNINIADSVTNIAERIAGHYFEDPEKKRQFKKDMRSMAQEEELAKLKANMEEFKARADVIQSESDSDHWLAAVWRPITMLVFVSIIANNYILAPYMNFLFGAEYALMLQLPPEIWSLIKVGLTGYVGARSAEKGLRMYQDRKNQREAVKEREKTLQKREDRKREEARRDREKQREGQSTNRLEDRKSNNRPKTEIPSPESDQEE